MQDNVEVRFIRPRSSHLINLENPSSAAVDPMVCMYTCSPEMVPEQVVYQAIRIDT